MFLSSFLVIPTKIGPHFDSLSFLSPQLIDKGFSKDSIDFVLTHLKQDGYFYAHNLDISKSLDFYNKLLAAITVHSANDASRRKKHSSDIDNMTTVDLDFPSVDIHSENSFSPSLPELVCFYCFDVDPALSLTGLTQIVDGQAIWDSLPLHFKQSCQFNLIEYDLSISLNRRIKGSGKKNWYLDYVGVSNCFLDFDSQCLLLKYKCFPINNSSLNKKISFTNHLFIDLATEPQIVNRFYPSSQILIDYIRDNILSSVSTFIKWTPGAFIIIDNRRCMHGRTAYNMSLKRDIGLKQILQATF